MKPRSLENYHADIRFALTARESAFLRSVLHHDFEKNRVEIYQELTSKWVTNPTADLITAFDYRDVDVTVSLHEITTTSPAEVAPGSHWPDLVARASASGGCMCLHLMIVSDGRGGRVVVIPLRRATSELQDGLKRIAAGMESVERGPISDFLISLRPEAAFEIH